VASIAPAVGGQAVDEPRTATVPADGDGAICGFVYEGIATEDNGGDARVLAIGHSGVVVATNDTVGDDGNYRLEELSGSTYDVVAVPQEPRLLPNQETGVDRGKGRVRHVHPER